MSKYNFVKKINNKVIYNNNPSNIISRCEKIIQEMPITFQCVKLVLFPGCHEKSM